MRRREEPFLPEYLLTWSVFRTTLIWTLIFNFLNSVTRGEHHMIAQVSLFVGLHFFMYGMIYLINASILKNVQGRKLPTALFLTLVLTSSIRGALDCYLSIKLGIHNQPDYFYYVGLSIAYETIALSIITSIVGEKKIHNLKYANLIKLNEELAQLDQATSRDLRNLDADLISEIELRIHEMLDAIKSAPANKLLNSIQSGIDEVLKPLSRKIYNLKDFVYAQSKPRKISWQRILIECQNPKIFPFWYHVVALSILGVPILVHKFGAITGLSVIGLYAAVFLPVTFVIGELTKRSPNNYNLLAFNLGNGLIILLIHLFNRLVTFLFNMPNFGFIGLTIGLYLINIAIAFGAYARAKAIEMEIEIQEISNRHAWNFARSSLVMNGQIRSLVNILHGQMQANLTSAFMRIASEPRINGRHDEILRELDREIEARLVQIKNLKFDLLEINQVISDISVLWDGIAKINFESEPNLIRKVNSDKPLLSALQVLINELVFNSIKHGGASAITISLTQSDENTVDLTVSNNGSLELRFKYTGVGSHLLEDSAISWDREQILGETITKVLLPMKLN